MENTGLITNKKDSCRKFIAYISKTICPDQRSENIYQGNGLSQIRRNNLKSYLTYMCQHPTDTIIIGEAPGFHGCGKTGIAFTDEYSINTLDFFDDKYSVMGNEREMSAGAIWSILQESEAIPFMWNIYPFQPQDNRTPNKEEIELGKAILAELFHIFDFKHIYCIGRTSYNTLKKDHPDAIYVRHPAHGGITQCKAQLSALLKVTK